MKRYFKILVIMLALSVFMNSSVTLAETAISGPVLGSISSTFGLRPDPFTGVTRSHDGIDIAAPYGAPVYAMQDGVIIRSGRRGGYGLAITIDHYYTDVPQIPRVQTTYGHNSVLIAKAGQYVRRGQVIAYVGSTGHSTGPHLHFEVTYKGRPVDPLDYLVKLPSYLQFVGKVREHNKYISQRQGVYNNN